MGDQPAGARSPGSTTARWRLAAAALVALVLTGGVAGGILALRGDPGAPTDYDSAVAERFLSVCTDDATALGFSDPEAFCACSYERVTLEIPFERFVQIDATMREDPEAVPEEIDRIRSDCFAGSSDAPAPTTQAPEGA